MNIGIVAHVDAGKTTVTENLLYLRGVIKSVGRVDHGDTQTDSMELERKKGISIKATPVSFYYGDIKINLIDTPGHVDFVAEVERSFSVLDGVVLVVSAREGIQSQTRVLIKTIKELKMPCVVFVNKIDRLGAAVKPVLADLSKCFDGGVIAMQEVFGEGSRDTGVRAFSGGEIFADNVDLLCGLEQELMERYITGDDIQDGCIDETVERQARLGCVRPVFFGSALYGLGVNELLSAITKYLPSAVENDGGGLSAVVFKIDNRGGDKRAYARVYQGFIKIRQDIQYNGKSAKVKSLRTIDNGALVNTESVGSGDVCVLSIKDLRVSDVLGEQGPVGESRRVSISSPALRVCVKPLNPADKRKLYETLLILSEEDPMLSFAGDPKGDKMYLNLFGEVQMDIIKLLLDEQYGITVEFSNLATIYKETPAGKGYAETLLGARGNYFRAGIGLEVEPLPRGSGLRYESKVWLGTLEKQFQRAIEEAVLENIKHGVYGLEITDAKVTLTFSDYDSVTSTPSDYRNLAPLVLMEACANAGMEMLEPVMEFELIVPENAASRALFDCRKMNAEINKTENTGGEYVIAGMVPADACKNYKLELASYTGSRGVFAARLHGYRETAFDERKTDADSINPATNKTQYLMRNGFI